MALFGRRAKVDEAVAPADVSSYVQDSRPYPHTDPSDRWGPELGVTHPTHGQVEILTGGRSTRPDPSRPPDEYWAGNIRLEDFARHGLYEAVDPGLDTVVAPVVKRFAERPIAPPPERWTALTNPHSYNFARPFDQELARSLNGSHFSMADHRRNYPILGMEPAISRRNTLRVEPPPYDTEIVDKANDPSTANPSATYTSPGIPPRSSVGRLT